MRQGYLHACVVLDSSESMNALKDAVQFSLNEFLGRLRNRMEWKKRLDVYKFSDRCEQIVDELDLNQISYDALHAAIAVENQGASAMNDAICHAIDALGEKLAAMPERERPETVVFAIVTDGRDNASKKFTLADVWKRVTCQSYVFSWKFEYLAMKANELRENCRLDETPIYPVINDVEEVERLEENDTVTELESESQAIYDESEDYDPANDAEQAQDSQIVKEPGFSDEGLYDAEDGYPIELESTSTLGNAEVESELEENLAAVSDEISQTDNLNGVETEANGSAAQFKQQEATPPDYSAIFFEPQVDLYRHEFRTLQSLSEILAGSDIDEYSTLKNDGATAKDSGAQTENEEKLDGADDQKPESDHAADDYDGQTEAPSGEPEENDDAPLGTDQEKSDGEKDAALSEDVSNGVIEPGDSESALEEEADDDNEAVEEMDAEPETEDGEELYEHADEEIPEEDREDVAEDTNPPAEENLEDNQSDDSPNADGEQDAIPEHAAAFSTLETGSIIAETAAEEVVKETSETENRDSISEENAGEDAAFPTGEEESLEEDGEDEVCETNDGEENSEEEECDEADVDGTDESGDVGLSEDISGETDEEESEIAEESEEDADEAAEEEESPQETDSDEQEEIESADGYEEIDEEEPEVAEESEEDADEAAEEEESPQETDSDEQGESESADGYEEIDEEESEDGGDFEETGEVDEEPDESNEELAEDIPNEEESEDGGDFEEDEETDGLEDELQEDYSDETEEEEEVFESVSDEELPEETGELEEETVSAETEETDSEEVVSELGEAVGGEEDLQEELHDAQNEEANESEPAADEELPREDGETEHAAESDAPEAVNAEVEPTNREEVSPDAAYHSESVRVENGSNVEEIAEPVSDSAPTGEVEDASDARQKQSETIPEETASRRPVVAPESTPKPQPEPRPVYSFKLPLSFQGVPETRAERPNEDRPQIEQVKGETDLHESIVKDNLIEEDEPVLINPSVDSFTIVPPKLVVPSFDERVETSNAPDKPKEAAAAERVAPRQPQKPSAPKNVENRVVSAPKKNESESKPESGSITATTADGKKIVLNGANLNQIREIMQGNQPEKAPAKEPRKAPQGEPASKPQSQQEEAPYEPPQLVVPPDMPETENDVFKPTSFPLDESFHRIADGKDSHFTLTVDAPVENRHGSRHKTLPMPGENYKHAEETPKSVEYSDGYREDGEGTADAPKTESLFSKIARSLKELFKGPNS